MFYAIICHLEAPQTGFYIGSARKKIIDDSSSACLGSLSSTTLYRNNPVSFYRGAPTEGEGSVQLTSSLR